MNILGKIIKSEIVDISPDIASKLLSTGNNDNRKIRRSSVLRYANQMSSGKWVLTHQGLALDQFDNIIDGQHRLHAVVESGVTVKMMVTVFEGRHTPLMVPMDVGLTRTTSDITGISKKDVEIVKMWLLAYYPIRRCARDDFLITDIYEKTKKVIQQINTTKNSTRGMVGVAAVRAAFSFGLLQKNQNAEYYEHLTNYSKKAPQKIKLIYEWMEEYGDHQYGGDLRRYVYGSVLFMLKSHKNTFPNSFDWEPAISDSRELFTSIAGNL